MNQTSQMLRIIIENAAAGKIDKQVAAQLLKGLKSEGKRSDSEGIAIVGISAMLPSADNIGEFWDNIRDRCDSIANFPDSRRQNIDAYLRYAGYGEDIKYSDGSYLKDIDQFDYKLFRIPPRDAALMDPFQRLFLRTAWSAFEDAGYGGKSLAGSRTGVYLGFASNIKDSYLRMIQDIDIQLTSDAAVGNISAMMPARISYLLDLKGPSMVVDTACSSSLVAVHLACQSIRNGDCDMALAGGLRVNLMPLDTEYYRGGLEASDGRTRAFDHSSDGAGISEGVATVLLKPLSKALKDKDQIYAVIKGSAINQDGASIGITAPNPEAQADVISRAWDQAGIHPETLSYIETHGTGTKLGDPLELEGLELAFQKYTDKKQFCPIGTVKSNMGHPYEAAGLVSLIKAALVIKNREIPPSLHFDRPNGQIDFKTSPVYVNTRLRKWEGKESPMRCAVSSFGFSGTNCHLVLEEAPVATVADASYAKIGLVVLSAKSEPALRDLVTTYSRLIQEKPPACHLQDLCYTASVGRGHYNFRLAIVAANLADLGLKLQVLSLAETWNEPESWFSYGEHKIVPASKSQLEPGDMTAASRKKLDRRVQEITQGINLSEWNDEAGVSELGSLYVQGADVDWVELYKGTEVRRVSLPVYPFESHRCWIDLPDELVSSRIDRGAAVSEQDTEEFHYTMQWRTAEWKRTGSGISVLPGTVLLMEGRSGAADSVAHVLARTGVKVIRAALGSVYADLSDNRYTLGDQESDYDLLFASLRGKSVDHIIHVGCSLDTGQSGIQSLNELQNSQRRGVYSVYYLVRALMRSDFAEIAGMTLIAMNAHHITGDEYAQRPEHAPFLSLSKVLNREHPSISFRSFDIDADTPADVWIEEALGTEDQGDYLIAYRGGQRYVEEFTRVQVAGDTPISVRPQGVYLITGGGGGIGLETARFLASKAPVRLALINRTPIPERVHWDNLMNQPGQAKLCRFITAVTELEAAGSEVSWYSADVADREAMDRVIRDMRTRYGAIHGIIHGAGVGGDQLLVDRSEERFSEVLASKIYGTWNLDELTHSDDLDFFVMYSSVATMFSGVTQADYVAANAYLDAFADERSLRGKRTLTVNWTTWKETGMSVDAGFTADTIFKTVLTAQAIRGLEQAMNSSIRRVLIGQLNFSGGGVRLLDKMQVRLSTELSGKVAEYLQSAASKTRSTKKAGSTSSGEVKLSGKIEGGYTATERHVASVCKEVLGFDEIDIYENFFELGADSILLLKIHAGLSKRYPGVLAVTDLFEFSTIHKLAEYIFKEHGESEEDTVTVLGDMDASATSEEQTSPENAKQAETCPQDQQHTGQTASGPLSGDLAIVGMALNVASTTDVFEFWEHIQGKVDHIRPLPERRQQDLDWYLQNTRLDLPELDSKAGAFIEDIDLFDYSFFKLSPKEASLTDPNQRLFLETVWRAIEDAGYGGGKLAGSDTGVYLGYSTNTVDMYSRFIYETDLGALPDAVVGNTPSIIPARISYLLNLKGPSMLVDTACSSSLTAVHIASRALLSGECSMAAVGGIKISTMPITKKNENMLQGLESGDGKTRAFDDDSDGAGLGEGIGVVMLKRLEDALRDGDQVYAVLKGTAMNQDGSSAGITAPNPAAQQEVITKAWKQAGIHPETITYMETHGTGTALGDPIEIKGIQNAFRQFTDRRQFCAVGSIKTNLGHTSEAAGMISLIKAALAVRHGVIPPNLHFNRPNRNIDFHASPVYVNTRLRPWKVKDGPRRCGVSAFGISGTNCHVILEEPPVIKPVSAPARPHLLVLSARSEEALQRLVAEYVRLLDRNERYELVDMCSTASTGRGHYPFRLSLMVRDTEGLLNTLRQLENRSFQSIALPGVEFGEHRTVPKSKKDRAAGEMTESEKLGLSQLMRSAIQSFVQDGRESEYLLKQIAHLYVQGADADWEELYAGEHARKVSLPAYPLERKRCWIHIPERPQLREVSIEEAAAPLHYAAMWKEMNRISMDQHGGNTEPVVILMDRSGIASSVAGKLEAEGRLVIKVYRGESYTNQANAEFTIRSCEEDYERFIRAVEPYKISQLLHFFALEQHADEGTVGELEESLDRGVYSLFYLSKAMSKIHFKRPVDLVLVTSCTQSVTGSEPYIRPEHAPMVGLGKTICHEMNQFRCRSIDIDDETPLDQWLQEIRDPDTLYLAAYRKGRRYVQELGEIPISLLPDQPIHMREGGVYLITGGTGGIGLETASALSLAPEKIKLVLMNRSPFPERATWEDVLSSGEEIKLTAQIGRIKEMEARGAEVHLYSVDIADPLQLASVLSKIRQQHGPVSGIIHGAGVAGEGFLMNKEREAFERVMRPKVLGTWSLDQLTRADHPDFFVMFSTATTFFSEPGQGDYTAANAYMDSFAAHRRQAGLSTLAVNWTAWKETGMARDFHANSDGGFKAITTARGIQGLQEAMGKDVTQVLIGELNREGIYQHVSDDMPLMLFSSDISEAIETGRKGNASRAQEESGDMKLLGRTDEDYSIIESALGRLWSKSLGVNELSIYDDFYELGGDSILGLKIANGLTKELSILVNTAEILMYPTIAESAAYLEESYGVSISGDSEGALPVLTRVEPQPYYPVSSAQKRFVVLDRLEGQNTNANIPRASIMEGDFEHGAFEQIIRKLIQRHESFRTSFEFLDGIPYQKVWDQVDFNVGYSESTREQLTEKLLGFVKPFELDQAPLFRFEVVKLDDRVHAVFFDMHHIITDGMSMDIIMQEIIDLYEGRELKPLTIQYKDYAVWHNALLSSGALLKQEEYWLNLYEDSIPQLKLPTDYPRPLANEFEGDQVVFIGNETLTMDLDRMAAKTGTTLFMLLLAAYNVLLSKYADQDDIVVGSPIAGRSHADLEDVVGVFINIITIRTKPKSGKTFLELLAEVREAALKSYENQQFQFEDLVRKLNLNRDRHRNLLFDAMFALQNVGTVDVTVGKFTTTPYEFGAAESRYDVYLEIIEKHDKLRFNLEYRTKLFKRETAEKMLHDYVALLQQLLLHPEQKLGEIELESSKHMLVSYDSAAEDLDFNF
ncbi:SDR family NAD(P)-dependent oxidoreductase [Paenibacillus sp. FSL L8-0435]|uniref:SDR family NAD(P)-dependent oxidoreductase n=1 Tax=Paenibacillus sp. FSL L8-0435 TaxID=2954618 RepID=UPI0030DD9D79